MHRFYQRKNDFFFACIVVAVFQVTMVVAITGTLDFARAGADLEQAKAQVPPAAPREAAPPLARAGPRRWLPR